MTERRNSGRGRAWWLLVPVLLLVGAGAAYAASITADPVYRATTSILVGQPLTAPTLSNETIETGQLLAATYADLVSRQPVLDPVARELGLDEPWQELAERVRTRVAGERSPLVIIEVEAPTRTEAISTAQLLGEQLIAISPTTAEFQQVEKLEKFVESRLGRLENEIDELEEQVDRLRSRIRRSSARQRDELRASLAEAQGRILDLEKNYASLLEFLTRDGVANYLQVFEKPYGTITPSRPKLLVQGSIGATIGSAIGLFIAYVMSSRSKRASRGVDRGRRSTDEHESDDEHESEASISPDRAWG